MLKKWHEIIVWSQFTDSKLEFNYLNRKKKKENTELGVRKYSTSSRNTYLKEISKRGFLFILPMHPFGSFQLSIAHPFLLSLSLPWKLHQTLRSKIKYQLVQILY